MSMHWLACCCGGCPATLEVTFSGVDAAICVDCAEIVGAGGFSRELEYVNLDGDWSGVPLDSSSGTDCYYVDPIILPAGPGVAKWNTYMGLACGGAPVLTGVIGRFTIEVDYEGGKVTRVEAHTTGLNPSVRVDLFSWSGSEDLDVAVSNQLACEAAGTDVYVTGGSITSGGTATVSLT